MKVELKVLYWNTRSNGHEVTSFTGTSEGQVDQMRQRYEARNGHLVYVSSASDDDTIEIPELDIDEDYD